LGTSSLKEVAEILNRGPSALSKLVGKINNRFEESEEHENRKNNIMSHLTE
jgi:hypothetical protein